MSSRALFSAQTANGNSDIIAWYGGVGTFKAWGAFEGATVKLQMSFDKENFIDVGSDVTLTAPGVGNFQLGSCWLRANMSGAGSPDPSVAAWVG